MVYDYSLFFLPLAALAVWDRRDSLIVATVFLCVSSVVWLQPFINPVPSLWFLMGFKLATVGGVFAESLLARLPGPDAAFRSREVVLA